MSRYSAIGRPRPQGGGLELAIWYLMRLTGLALFVLRLKDPTRERPFPTPWFPLPPISSARRACSLEYARWRALLGGATTAVNAAFSAMAPPSLSSQSTLLSLLHW